VDGAVYLLVGSVFFEPSVMVAMSDDMVEALDQERKARKLESVPETVRAVLGEYFKRKGNP
jgi:hypothetical protein